MYQAEHLDLITNVQDSFTSPLTRLSTMLETVGQQADQLDPIYIRVIVNDRQLDELQAKLATTSLADVGSGVSGNRRVEVGDELLGGRDHTLADVSETIRDTSRSLEDTLTDQFGREGGASNRDIATLMGATAASQAAAQTSGGITPDGDGTTRQRLLSPREVGLFESIIGSTTTPALANRNVDAEDLLFGEAAPFGVDANELDNFVNPQLLASAFDTEAFNEAFEKEHGMDTDAQMTKRALSGVPISEMMNMVGMEDTFENRLRFQRRFTKRSSRLRYRVMNSLQNMRVGMTQFYDLLAAGLPLLFTFVGAIPAVVGGMAALGAAALGAAGALGAIAGLGMLGAAAQQSAGSGPPGMSDIGDTLEDLPDEFWESFRGISEELAPTFLDGLEGVEQWFDMMAARAELLPMLEDDARDFGTFMADFTANTFENFIRFAEAARPVFDMIAGGIREMDALRGLSGSLALILPQLRAMTSLFIESLPGIMSFSQGMAVAATNVLRFAKFLFGGIAAVLEFIPFVEDGHRMLGLLSGAFLTLTTGVLFASKVLTIFTTDLGLLYLAMIYNKMAAIGLTGAIGMLATAITGLLGITGIGVVLATLGALGAKIAGNWSDASSNIDDATNSLREFQRQQQNMGTRGAYMGNLDHRTEVYVDVQESQTLNIEGSDDPYADQQSASFISSNFSHDKIPQ